MKNPYARPPRESHDDDAIQLRALSLRDDHGLSVGAVAREVGETRNTVLGWFQRIDAADAIMHGLPMRAGEKSDAARLAGHRRHERVKALAC